MEPQNRVVLRSSKKRILSTPSYHCTTEEAKNTRTSLMWEQIGENKTQRRRKGCQRGLSTIKALIICANGTCT